MICISHPTGILDGIIELPSSKSLSNRALIIRALSGENFEIEDLSTSDDTKCLRQLLNNLEYEIDAGEGGTTFRFLLAYLALKGNGHVLKGSDRLLQRPITPLVETLNKLGASIEYIYGQKVIIHPSSLHGGRVEADSSLSSQFISALMLIGPYLPEGISIVPKGKMVSAPYITMTAKLMQQFGAAVELNDKSIDVQAGAYKSTSYHIEKDWSCASYWLEAAAFSSKCNLLLKGQDVESLQGDRVMVDLIRPFGVRFEQEDDGLRLIKEKQELPLDFQYDFTDHPDIVPAMLMTCALLGVKAEFYGTANLRLKESDRVEALMNILNAVGCKATTTDNSISLQVSSAVKPATSLQVFNDHRMALCSAPMSLLLDEIFIDDESVVNKSYPGYWNDLKKAGFLTR